MFYLTCFPFSKLYPNNVIQLFMPLKYANRTMQFTGYSKQFIIQAELALLLSSTVLSPSSFKLYGLQFQEFGGLNM